MSADAATEENEGNVCGGGGGIADIAVGGKPITARREGGRSEGASRSEIRRQDTTR